MAAPKNPILVFLMRYAQSLRFPYLFLIVVGLFFVDLIIPDVIPFGDEILLGLGATLLASMKRRVDARTEPEPDAEA